MTERATLRRLARAIACRIPGAVPVWRVVSAPGRRRRSQASADVAATLVAAFARARPRATFVQVGSNDGVRLDPLRDTILKRRWNGVMVEPVPYIFERLRRNYADIDRVRTENVAIADHDGTQALYYIPEAPNDDRLPMWYDQLASFRRDVLLKHIDEIPDIENRIRTIDVPCLTFDSLCRRHHITLVDLVHIDTEGYDWEVVSSIDLERLAPTVILFEHYHMDRDSYRLCTEHLRAHGYELLPIGMDTMCVRERALSRRDRSFRRAWTAAKEHPHLVFRADVEARRSGKADGCE